MRKILLKKPSEAADLDWAALAAGGKGTAGGATGSGGLAGCSTKSGNETGLTGSGAGATGWGMTGEGKAGSEGGSGSEAAVGEVLPAVLASSRAVPQLGHSVVNTEAIAVPQAWQW